MTTRRALVACLLLGSLLASCTSGSNSASDCAASKIPEHNANSLIVEGDPWSGYAPFRNDQLLTGSKYNTHYVEQVCQDVRAGDVTAGRADFEVTTLDQYLLNRPAGTVVGVIDQSRGADALALNTVDYPYLQSVDNLGQLVAEFKQKGETPVLAYTGNSPSEMLLNELANTSEELRLADFKLVSVDQSATAYAMLQKHEAQVAIIWAPDTSAAIAAGYTVALSSKDVPDSIVDVIVASNKVIQRDPSAVQAVVSAFYSTMDNFLANPPAFEQFIATDGKLAPQDARTVIDGVKFYGSHDADAFLNDPVFPLDQPQVDQSLKSIAGVLALSHRGIDVRRAQVDGRFVRQLAG